MDLRGFDARRAGCEFELGELARRRRPDQVVLLTDASTDRDRLDRLLGTMAVRPQVLDVSGNLAVQSRAAFIALLRAAR
jgi:hypothetical protein